MWQERVLDRLLDPVTLARIRDSELKVPADQDAFTTAELLDRLSASIFSEIAAAAPGEYSNRKPAIPSLRRSLQRAYLSRLAGLALGSGFASTDAESLAAAELRSLEGRIEALLARQDLKLDPASRAHLADLGSRIEKVLDADVELRRP
jgi:hypothetical protein